MDDSDAGALVKAALQNDDDAARALVRRLYPLVAKIVRAHRSRRTSEEDLCQMIFIKVFQKLSHQRASRVVVVLKRSFNQSACVRIIHVIESASTPLTMTGSAALWLQLLA